ncbi:MAG: AsmA family protein, partial [Chitinophagaceae bacterium]
MKIVLFLLLFLVILFLLVLTPPVQRFATTKVENYLEKKLKTKVEIGSISIGLPRKVVLNDIFLEDQTKDTLIAGGTIKADITLFKLLSNEVEIHSLQLKDITAKVKRTLPDTAFNFQFIVDAFVTEQVKTDTAQTANLKLEINNLAVDNLNVVYKDVLTGDDMFLHVGGLKARIDTLDPYNSHFSIPTLDIKNVTAFLNQSQPLAEAESAAQDIAEAAVPTPMKLNFGVVTLDSFNVKYENDVSAFYTQFNIGHLSLGGKDLDFQNRIVYFDELKLDNTLSAIRLGKKQMAKVLEKEIEKEVELHKQKNWTFRVNNIAINNNTFQFDNDNTPQAAHGIDYAHMRADSFSLHIKDFVLGADSIGGTITKGEFKEKSVFQLNALEA